MQDPQVTVWLSHASPTRPSTDAAWLSHAAGRPELLTMHPQPLKLASARKLLQSRLVATGPFAHALRPTRLRERRQRPPHMLLTGLPARPASSAGADRQRSTQQAARQLCLPQSCRRTPAPPLVAATALQPASHASR